ncbi:MAG: TolC family protein [Desulfobacterales bacterium]|nr:TolC family protein [Desulfobacterales bacterium]
MTKVKKNTVYILTLAMIIYSSLIYAQEKLSYLPFSTNTPLDLDILLNFAHENSFELKSAYTNWLAVKEKAPQVSVLPDPKLTYGIVMVRTDKQAQKVSIAQTFPWFGKLDLKEKLAIKEAEAVYQDYVNRKFQLIGRIKNIFYEYAYLAQAVKINTEHQDILKAMEEIANIRSKVGSINQNVLIRIQIEQGKIEDRIKELERIRPAISYKIYSLIGSKQLNEVLPWPNITSLKATSISDDKLKELLRNKNPNLRKINALYEKETQALNLAKKNFYPDVTLSLERDFMDMGDDQTIAMFSINLPIWRSSLKAAEYEVIKKRESLSLSLKDQENQLSAQMDLLLYYLRDAERKANLYRNTLIPKAKQAIEIAFKEFETGKATFLDILDTERSLLEFQLTEARQVTNRYQQLAEIETLIGSDISQALTLITDK